MSSFYMFIPNSLSLHQIPQLQPFNLSCPLPPGFFCCLITPPYKYPRNSLFIEPSYISPIVTLYLILHSLSPFNISYSIDVPFYIHLYLLLSLIHISINTFLAKYPHSTLSSLSLPSSISPPIYLHMLCINS